MGNELAGGMLSAARVECYSGYEYPERPTALYWQGVRVEIVQVERDFRTPEGKKFRVCTREGQVFDLFYQLLNDEWLVVPV